MRLRYKFKLLTLCLLSSLPLSAVERLAANFSLDPSVVPEEFIQYFYTNALPTQIFLNNKLLFEGEVRLHPSGGIKLQRLLHRTGSNYSYEESQRWQQRLAAGVTVGSCKSNCSFGLKRVDYQLNEAGLRLYTRDFESDKLTSRYLPTGSGTPDGLIVNNSLYYSYHSDKHNFSFYPGLLMSIGGFTLNSNASFWRSSNEDKIEHKSARWLHSALHNFYLEKQLQGHFINAGVFTPSQGFSNVRIGQSNARVIGALFGSSDNLRYQYERASIYPVYITGRPSSVAEVYREGRLIYTQPVGAGLQLLETKTLPNGIYDVLIKVRQDGMSVAEQRERIYKPGHWNDQNQRLHYYLWGGRVFERTWFDREEREKKGDSDKEKRKRQQNAKKSAREIVEGDVGIGGGIDVLLHPKIIVSFAANGIGEQFSAQARANLHLSDRNQITPEISYKRDRIEYIRLNMNQSFKAAQFSIGYKNEPCYSKECVMLNSVQGAVSANLGNKLRATLQAEYLHMPKDHGISGALGFNGAFQAASRTMNWHLRGYDRTQQLTAQKKYRNRGVELGIDIPLSPDQRTYINVGLEDSKAYLNAGHRWQPFKNPLFSGIYSDVRLKDSNASFNNNIGLSTRWLQGNSSIGYSTKRNAFYGHFNLRNTHSFLLGYNSLVLDSNYSNNVNAALVVDLESARPNTRLQVSGASNSKQLRRGRNVVPLRPWHEHNLQFYTDAQQQGLKIYPQFHSIRLNRGSVGYVKVKAIETHTLVGTLLDEKGVPIRQREIASDITQAYINEEGIFTIEAGINQRHLTVTAADGKPELQCHFELTTRRPQSAQQQMVDFITAHCVRQSANAK